MKLSRYVPIHELRWKRDVSTYSNVFKCGVEKATSTISILFPSFDPFVSLFCSCPWAGSRRFQNPPEVKRRIQKRFSLNDSYWKCEKRLMNGLKQKPEDVSFKSSPGSFRGKGLKLRVFASPINDDDARKEKSVRIVALPIHPFVRRNSYVAQSKRAIILLNNVFAFTVE